MRADKNRPYGRFLLFIVRMDVRKKFRRGFARRKTKRLRRGHLLVSVYLLQLHNFHKMICENVFTEIHGNKKLKAKSA